MCGIAGIISVGKALSFTDKIIFMNKALKHRGPDNHSDWKNNDILLAHSRLSIIDLSAQAHQPFFSADKRFILVFNGEIYNYHQIRLKIIQEIKNVKFKTNSDTEVILEAYKAYGKNCLKLFNGMFAFAIWDIEKKELFAARDRMGEKPFYFHHFDSTFIFASEINSILESGLVERKINKNALYDYLNYQTAFAPMTMVNLVYQLMPGEFLEFKNNVVYKEIYWKPEVVKEDVSEEKCSFKIKSLFEESIKLRMVADVEVGAFLSGGIDSSAIVAQMSEISSQKIHTFSVIFGEKDYSEEKYSELIANRFNTNHHSLTVNSADFLNELPAILKATDSPGGDGPNTYIVAKATRKTGIKVALSGVGGDELFAGYPVFKQAVKFRKQILLRKSPKFLRSFTGSLYHGLKKNSTSLKLKRILTEEKLTEAEFYAHSRQLFSNSESISIIGEFNKMNSSVKKMASAIFKQYDSAHLLSAISICEMQTYLQNILLRDGDQMTMAHALEVRAPFLDHHLIQYVLSVNDKEKYPHTPKQLFTKAMGDLLPKEIINRKKMGFVFPWKDWMKNELFLFCDEKINDLSERSIFNKEAVLKLWNSFIKNDKTVTWTMLWHLVSLEVWMQTHRIES